MTAEVWYIAWKGGNGTFSKWHIAQNATYTFCGKFIPLKAQLSGEQRNKPEDTCRMCWAEYVKNLRIGA